MKSMSTSLTCVSLMYYGSLVYGIVGVTVNLLWLACKVKPLMSCLAEDYCLFAVDCK